MTNAVFHKVLKTVLLSCLLLVGHLVAAQTIIDSTKQLTDTVVVNDEAIDSVLRVHSPRTAAIRSAIIPGWGQVYNKKYWKVPLVYGALGTTAGVFIYNIKWYKRFRFAYRVLQTNDTANFRNIHPLLEAYVDGNDVNGLQFNRNEFRRNIDYTVLVFILLWGLNVVDASVDAHLKSFDVSPDLSLQLKPGYSELGQTNGVSLVLKFK